MQTEAPIISHLIELRNRLLYSFLTLAVAVLLMYLVADCIYDFLLQPLVKIFGKDQSHKIIYTGLTEAFFTYMRLAFYAGIFITMPVFLLQFYIFLAPGLYKHEKTIIVPYLIAVPCLFWLGAATVYYLIIPAAWKYFVSFEHSPTSGISIELLPRISEYLELVIHLIFAFGLAFQLPVVLTLLVQANIVKVSSLISKRKFIIVIIFAIAAILTPPDAISQIGLALPMILLYELAIFICKYIEKNKG